VFSKRSTRARFWAPVAAHCRQTNFFSPPTAFALVKFSRAARCRVSVSGKRQAGHVQPASSWCRARRRPPLGGWCGFIGRRRLVQRWGLQSTASWLRWRAVVSAEGRTRMLKRHPWSCNLFVARRPKDGMPLFERRSLRAHQPRITAGDHAPPVRVGGRESAGIRAASGYTGVSALILGQPSSSSGCAFRAQHRADLRVEILGGSSKNASCSRRLPPLTRLSFRFSIGHGMSASPRLASMRGQLDTN
jgi:hypothetical protein